MPSFSGKFCTVEYPVAERIFLWPLVICELEKRGFLLYFLLSTGLLKAVKLLRMKSYFPHASLPVEKFLFFWFSQGNRKLKFRFYLISDDIHSGKILSLPGFGA